MKPTFLTYLIILVSIASFAQPEQKKSDEKNRILGDEILAANGMKYYDSSSYEIRFHWKNVEPRFVSFSTIEKTLREATYHGKKLKLQNEFRVLSSESITAEEIANTPFMDSKGNERKIKDIAYVERYQRKCFRTISTPVGLFLSCRTFDNKPQVFLYANHTLSEYKQLTNFIICDYSPSANTILISRYDSDPSGDSMSHEIFTFNLKSLQLKRQGDLGWLYGSPIYSKNYDTIFVTVNVKNKDGIGSEAKKLPIKVK